MNGRASLSVAMSNFNHGRFLPQALESVLSQSVRPLEVIIVDDASIDNSVEIIRQFAARDPIIRLIRNERNVGPIENSNMLIGRARGDYVIGVACDDVLLPGMFEKSLDVLTQHPEAGVSSTLTAVINEEGEYQGIAHTPVVSWSPCFFPPDEVLRSLLRHGSWFMGNTVVYRRAALVKAGAFVVELGPFCDGFITVVLALRHGACFLPEPLAAWRRMRGTYAGRTGADIHAMLAIKDEAKRLMATTYRDLFPAAYVDDWERMWLFSSGSNYARSWLETQMAALSSLMAARAAADSIFLAATRLELLAVYALVKAYLFIRFRRRHLWRELRRKGSHLIDPRLVRLAKATRRDVERLMRAARDPRSAFAQGLVVT
jgi:glycosyltransferase involved in cell wall biosynthesis